jgi:RES domain-containing protein
MILYRLAQKKFATDLSGTGAKLFGGRWNLQGIPVLYTSECISLGVLEVLANADTLSQLQLLQLVAIEIPAHTVPHEIKLEGLKKNWWADFDYSQWMGSEILKSNKHLVVKCPSAIIEQEHNYLVNPEHPSFKKVKLHAVDNFRFDERLFKI